MAIINLGQMGERRESALGGISEAVGKYTDALSKAKSEHAKLESDQQEKSRTYFREAYKSYWKKKESGQNIGEAEEKEFLKASKKYLPEWFDGTGKAIRYPIEKEITPQEKNIIEVDLEKMKRNLPPSPEGASSIIKMIQYQVDYGDMNPKEGEEAIKFYMKFIQPSRYSGAMAGEQGGGAQVNQQDPLSILGR